ncbi:hypothetical protein MYMA111404_03000 [Mycoplasma marinum]|uniref:Uncharacterized protein n=1 Tax=Mycoplasma marinum TaxID=1937190 RepID=A0A4R0XKV6_9MOLU|nr:hypothetical protein [Mycoplasma marinum]TCG11273.1 hypothetical protein C4B24_02400 [Mycoplasma marinum]
MNKLTYTTDLNSYKFEAEIEYKKYIPKFILDLSKKALENQKSIADYINSKGLIEYNQIYTIIKRGFENFEEILNFQDNELQKILDNNFLIKRINITGKVESLSPVVNKFKIVTDELDFSLYNEDDLNEELEVNFKRNNPDCFDAKIINIYKTEEKKKPTKIFFSIKDNEIICFDDEVNYDFINFQQLKIENNLCDNELNSKDVVDSSYKFLSVKVADSFNINSQYSSVVIKDATIIFTEFVTWKNLPMYKTSVIRDGNFKKDTTIYKIVLKLYKEGDIQINNFIFMSFLFNEFDIRDRLVSGDLLNKILINNDNFRKILLMDIDLKLPTTINIDLASKILKNASTIQVPIILKKLTKDVRNKMTSFSLIKRLHNLNPEYLSEFQWKVYKDGQKRMEILNKDYASAISTIVTSGIRERIKSFNKTELKMIGGKKTKQWLDKKIGHSKGNEVINEKSLDQAKKIISKFNEIISSRKAK